MPRHLTAVDDTHTPAATDPEIAHLPRAAARDIAVLTAAHDRACQAAQAPEVTQEHEQTARRLLEFLGAPATVRNLAAVRDELRGAFVHGRMDRDPDDETVRLATVLRHPRFGGDTS